MQPPVSADPSPSIPSASGAAVCASCGQAVVGKYCANCGAAAGVAPCAGCGGALTAGANYCHRCGTPAGASAAARGPSTSSASIALPWTVAAIALVALVASFAGQRFSTPRGSGLDAPSNALPQAGLDFPQPAGPAGGSSGPVGSTGPGAGGDAPVAPFAAGGPNEVARRAPDISQMSPEERAARLYNRVMMYMERSATGSPAATKANRDSAQMFSVMAGMAYQQLPALSLDQRYDLARIAQVGGDAALAQAQTDTILRTQPNHLLGIVMATSLAGDAGDRARVKALDVRLLAAEAAERRRALPEYTTHGGEIDSAVARARRRQ